MFGRTIAILAVSLQACTTVTAPPVSILSGPQSLPPYRSSDSSAPVVDIYAGLTLAIRQAASKPTDDVALKALLAEAMSMAEFRCNQYFDTLGKVHQDLAFNRKETSLAGGAISASLGLANASAKSIANTGALFGFTTASMDSFQDTYLFSPDVESVRRLALDALRTNAAQISADIHAKKLTYSGVVSYVKQYESNCQPAAIRDFVNKAVSQVTTAPTSGPRLAPAAAGAQPDTSAGGTLGSAAGTPNVIAK
ncbi:MAG: hypothetical protein KF778_19795 [Rhodocyclaceae bacterium]|nr:hypothetical protein [Rhodocyclaceae bacterium]